MGQLDTIVNVQISRQTQAPSQPGFGTPMILGEHTRFLDLIRYYTDTAGMLADGFLVADPEYIHAAAIEAQDIVVERFAVGRRTPLVQQLDTISVAVIADNTVYSATINGLLATINSGVGATDVSILTALKAAIDALLQPVTTTVAVGPTLTISADVPGNGFSDVVTPNLTLVPTTPNHGVADDIADIRNVTGGDDWYGLVLTSKNADDILQAAALIETLPKFYMAGSQDADIPTNVITDVLSKLQALNYDRTALIYHSQAVAKAPDAAWVGEEFPKVPGSSTYKFKTLKSVPADFFTADQRQKIIGTVGVPGKNGNIYETVGGVDITEEGFAVSGQFIDITIGIDWLSANLKAAIFALLTSVDKVPYTDQGADSIRSEMNAVFEQGITNGLIAKGSVVINIPPVLSESQANRANRYIPDITFSCRFAGAIHFVKIQGIVTV